MNTSKKSSDKKAKNTSPISIINPNAAGIDIGDKMHVVAVPDGRSEEPFVSSER